MASSSTLDLIAGIPSTWRQQLLTLLRPQAFTIDLFIQADAEAFDGDIGMLPEPDRVFEAFKHSNFEETRVVILGDIYTE